MVERVRIAAQGCLVALGGGHRGAARRLHPVVRGDGVERGRRDQALALGEPGEERPGVVAVRIAQVSGVDDGGVGRIG